MSDLREKFGNARVKFWMCPLTEHSERRDVVTVEWEGDLARCTAEGCTLTSANTSGTIRMAYDCGVDDQAAKVEAVLEHAYPVIPMSCWTLDQEAAVVIAHAALQQAMKRDIRAALAPEGADLLAKHARDTLLAAADEIDEIDRIGKTPTRHLSAEQLATYHDSVLSSDEFVGNDARPIISAWLRGLATTRADRIETGDDRG